MPKHKLHPKSKKELAAHTLWLFKIISRGPHLKLRAIGLRELFKRRFPRLKPQQLSNSLMSLQRVGVIRKAKRFGQGEKDGAYMVTARGRYAAQRIFSKAKKTLGSDGNLT